ncbi:DNA-binding response regulator [Streptococcus cuniculi]|uniref:DNA-binding response regulator n=1 Tax=Streptococcus cuniculi TaxID=1432788 RepID=A0A1Q8E6P2_9STRE|nr:LytTR family DNA-binding domain-containing protein [Streptococcus cuniculi]OLF47455.1 DNA-binding response regulator [Streptococcus cuniculi]
MKIAIVEDQKVEQERLTKYIKDYCHSIQRSVEITCFNDGIDITSDYHHRFNIIYLDVEMEIMDGMTTAQKIRAVDKDVLLVFVTNHSQVAIQGYAVEAIDFLLKPLSNFVFEEHFKKMLRKLPTPEEEQQYLYVKNKASTFKIAQKEIYYIESEGHQLHIHSKQETITISNTLKNMEQLLDKKSFFRSNSGYIVNLAYVEKIEGNLAYIQGEPLQISRPRKKDFLTALTNYIGDTLL